MERQPNVPTTTRVTFREAHHALETSELQLRGFRRRKAAERSLLDGRGCRNKFTFTVSRYPIHFHSIASSTPPPLRAAVSGYSCGRLHVWNNLCRTRYSFSLSLACVPLLKSTAVRLYTRYEIEWTLQKKEPVVLKGIYRYIDNRSISFSSIRRDTYSHARGIFAVSLAVLSLPASFYYSRYITSALS